MQNRGSAKESACKGTHLRGSCGGGAREASAAARAGGSRCAKCAHASLDTSGSMRALTVHTSWRGRSAATKACSSLKLQCSE